MATHSSVLVWGIPGTGEPGGLPPMGSHRVRHDWSDLAAAAAGDWQQELEHRICTSEKLFRSEPRDVMKVTSWSGLLEESTEKPDPVLLEDMCPCCCCCCWVAQSCPTVCDPMDCSTPGFPVLHRLLELAQTHVHWVGDAIQPSISSSAALFSSCSQPFPASGSFPMSRLFASGGQVLELQPQYQSFQWIFRVDFL